MDASSVNFVQEEETAKVSVYCGIDWAEAHHDIVIVGDEGQLLARRRIEDTAAGLAQLLTLLAEHGDQPGQQVPVAIETGRGLLVACLAATGRDVRVINPMAAARYRERVAVTRTKSDAADALMLARILRTDRHAHRPLPKDSDLVTGWWTRCWRQGSGWSSEAAGMIHDYPLHATPEGRAARRVMTSWLWARTSEAVT